MKLTMEEANELILAAFEPRVGRPPAKIERVPISARIKKSTKQKLINMAESTGVSLSEYVEDILTKHIRSNHG